MPTVRALPREPVIGPHHIVAAVLAKVVLVSAVLPEFVVELLCSHGADGALLRGRELSPHILPQIRLVEDMPRVGVHGASLIPLERVALFEPLSERELRAGCVDAVWRGERVLEHVRP
mgnify:CR=1 FL=1